MNYRTTASHLSHFIAGSVALVGLNIFLNEGFHGVSKNFIYFLRKLPGVNSVIAAVLKQEVAGAKKLLAGMEGESDAPALNVIPIPKVGVETEQVVAVMDKIHLSETASEEGRAFAYTYTSEKTMQSFSIALKKAYETFAESASSGSPSHESMIRKCWSKFMHSNALNPMMYPSLQVSIFCALASSIILLPYYKHSDSRPRS